jgi:hypothetical protein
MQSMAGRGRGWGAAAQGSRDCLHHTLDIGEHIVVPEPQHAIVARVQVRGSLRIRCDATRLIVLSTIEFDHQTRAMAGEVREVWTNRCLPAKVRAVDAQAAKMLPQNPFGIGRLVPHRAGARHASVTSSLIWSLPQRPPTPDLPSLRFGGRECKPAIASATAGDPSPPLASLAWGGETRGAV